MQSDGQNDLGPYLTTYEIKFMAFDDKTKIEENT